MEQRSILSTLISLLRTGTAAMRVQLGARLAVSLIAIGIALVGLRGDQPAVGLNRQMLTVETGADELRAITLADGTYLQINEKSIVKVLITPATRRIDLLRGEASYQVARDPNRRFIVRTPGVTTRAIGTIFGTRITEDGSTDIDVLTGMVSVEYDGDEERAPEAAAPRFSLGAGQSARVTQKGELQLGRNASLANTNGWPQMELRFANARLGDVIADFNGYYKVPIRFKDPSLADLLVSGVFNPYDRPSLLQYLMQIHGMTSEQTRDGSEWLSRRAAMPPR